jgi:hypothetical protein
MEVCRERCHVCLFGPNKIVSDARRKQILRDCRRRDVHFICHKSSIHGDGETCCRGFYDTQTSQLIRIAQRLGVVKFIDVPEHAP